MALRDIRDFVARLLGRQAAPDPRESDLRARMQAGDEARQARQPETALQAYEEGLALARERDLPHIAEIFLAQIGALHTDQAHFEEAEQAFNEALALAEQAGESYRKARALLNLGAYNLRRTQLKQAQSYLEQALDLARRSADPVTAGLALGNLADLYLKQRNPSYALRLLREAAPQALANPQQATYLLGRIGQAHLALGETEQGVKYLGQALRLAEQNGQSMHELTWASLMADQLFQAGQLEDALRLYERIERLAGEVGTPPPEYNASRSRANRATALHRLGRQSDALALAQQVMDEARAEGNAEIEGVMRSTLGSVHQALGNADEAISSLEAAIAFHGQRAKDDPERIKAMLAMGSLYQDRGQLDKALEIYESALAAVNEEDRVGRAQTLRRIGSVLHQRGEFQAALEKWLAALNLFEASGEPAQMARLLVDIAGLRRALTGINAAMGDYERATVLLNQVKDAGTRGVVLSTVANLYTDLGEIETAKSHYEESLELARQSANRRAESLRLGNYAWYHIMVGQPHEAIRLLEQALSISRTLNDPLFISIQTSNLGLAHHELKDYTRAVHYFDQAVAQAEQLAEPRWAAMIRSNLGRTLLAQDKTQEAIALLEASLPVSRETRDQETVARTLTRLGEGYLRQGRIDDAERAGAEADSLARKWGYRKGNAEALVVRAGVAQARGDTETHRRYLREARRLFNIVRDPMAEQLARVLGEPQV